MLPLIYVEHNSSMISFYRFVEFVFTKIFIFLRARSKWIPVGSTGTSRLRTLRNYCVIISRLPDAYYNLNLSYQ